MNKKSAAVLIAMLWAFLPSIVFAQKKPIDVNSASDIAVLKADAEKGDRGAQYELSMVYSYKQDFKNSLEWLIKSAENGFAKAQYTLGTIYQNGNEQVRKDSGAALKWLTKSAESGYAKAQYSLGELYYSGSETVEKNYDSALKWLNASKEKGYKAAKADEMIADINGKIEVLKKEEPKKKKNKKDKKKSSKKA